MSEEEREILQGLDDMKHLEINPQYKVKIINGILDLYNKEKLNSLSLSEQLSKEKEKNKLQSIEIINCEYLIKDSVAKSKIKEKIRIRKEEKSECKDSIEADKILREIYVLEELLGE